MLHRKDMVFKKPSIFQSDIEGYAERHSTPYAPELEKLRVATQLRCPEWAGITTSAAQISFVAMLAGMIGARRALEVGTFTGHGTLGLAAVLPADGEIVTIDSYVADERALDLANDAFATSPHRQKIKQIRGDALEAIKAVDGPFDIVFVDADKPNYIAYYEEILGRGLLADNGMMVFDNTLWGGLVLESEAAEHEDAQIDEENTSALDGDAWLANMLADWSDHVNRFNAHVRDDRRVWAVLLTVKDGMTLVRHAIDTL